MVVAVVSAAPSRAVVVVLVVVVGAAGEHRILFFLLAYLSSLFDIFDRRVAIRTRLRLGRRLPGCDGWRPTLTYS